MRDSGHVKPPAGGSSAAIYTNKGFVFERHYRDADSHPLHFYRFRDSAVLINPFATAATTESNDSANC